MSTNAWHVATIKCEENEMLVGPFLCKQDTDAFVDFVRGCEDMLEHFMEVEPVGYVRTEVYPGVMFTGPGTAPDDPSFLKALADALTDPWLFIQDAYPECELEDLYER